MMVKFICVCLCVLLFFSCQNQTIMNKSEEIILISGVESMLDGSEVVCSNIATTEYTVGKETKEGLTANLALPNQEEWIRVGAGNSFELNEKTWTVILVKKDAIVVKEQVKKN